MWDSSPYRRSFGPGPYDPRDGNVEALLHAGHFAPPFMRSVPVRTGPEVRVAMEWFGRGPWRLSPFARRPAYVSVPE